MLEDLCQMLDDVDAALARVERLVVSQDQARTDWTPTENDTASARMHELVDYLVAGVTPGNTWCNQATKIIARDVGAPWEGEALLDNDATVIAQNLRNMINAGAYRLVATEADAEALANEGVLVIAAATGPEVNSIHGHIVTLRPRVDGDDANPGYNAGGNGVLVNHIGTTVGIRRMSNAFGQNWGAATYHTPRDPYD